MGGTCYDDIPIKVFNQNIELRDSNGNVIILSICLFLWNVKPHSGGVM